jgi:hypothetical protein
MKTLEELKTEEIQLLDALNKNWDRQSLINITEFRKNNKINSKDKINYFLSPNLPFIKYAEGKYLFPVVNPIKDSDINNVDYSSKSIKEITA